MIVLIDNGHGKETAGKRSPNGLFREYFWTRQFAAMLQTALKRKRIQSELIVPEENYITLATRVRRVNKIYDEHKGEEVVLISIHNDAAGNGLIWQAARGFSVFVSPNASAKSKDLATCIANSVRAAGIKVRKPLPDQNYWEKNLMMCSKTKCPAVLCENLFQDNKDDVVLLESSGFQKKLLAAYVEAISGYFAKRKV